MPSLFTSSGQKDASNGHYILNLEHRLDWPRSPEPQQQRLWSRANICHFMLHNVQHYMKLAVLIQIALAHVFLLNGFLNQFSALEALTQQAENEAKMRSNASANSLYHLRNVYHDFLDIQKNQWITVGAMCMVLATSTFFLFNESKVGKWTVAAIKGVDFFGFATITVGLFSEIVTTLNLYKYLQQGLLEASRLTNTTNFISALRCTITPRENIRLCREVMLSSILPVKILEYLFILCALTLAYIGLAYLIEYCIRHWFPPTTGTCHAKKLPKKKCNNGKTSPAAEPLVLSVA